MWSYISRKLNDIRHAGKINRVVPLFGIIVGVFLLTFPELTYALGAWDVISSGVAWAVGGVVDNQATRAILTTIGALFMTLAAVVLAIAGMVFNYLIDMTIVNFQGQLYSYVQQGIEDAWTVFRDIANILIIGMTVFIAISTILGVQEYNAKKLLSRVLIIAVLINFSLLFTKIIIDASNFTAKQFYDAMAIPSSSNASNSNTGIGQFTDQGIAGNFLQLMGVSSVTNTWTQINEAGGAAKENGHFGGIIAIAIHSILGTIILLAAAGIMFYGSFLMLSRALLMFFLLMTSSVAFASYLVPNLQAMGWDPWWSSLKRNAFFAPLFMILLWASLQVARGLVTTQPGGASQQTGSIGSLIKNPAANSSNIHALVVYLIILGLLYGAIRISSKFANSIGGFSYASKIPAIAGGLAGRSALRTGDALYRNTVGLLASRRQGKARENAMKWQEKASTSTGLKKQYYNLRSGIAESFMQGYQKTAKSDLNMGGKLAGGLKKMGMESNLGYASKGGYAGVVASKAGAVATRAKALTRSDKEKEELIEAEKKQMLKSDSALKEQREASAIQVQQTKEALTSAITEGLNKQAEHNKKIDDLETKHKDATTKMQDALEKAKTEPNKAAEHQKDADSQKAEAEKLKSQITQAKAERETHLKALGEKINVAHETAQRAAHVQELFEGNLTELAKKNVHKQMGNGDEEKGKVLFERSAADVAGQLAQNSLTDSVVPGKREDIAKAARKELGEAKKQETNIASILKAAGLAPKEGTPAAAAAKPADKPKK